MPRVCKESVQIKWPLRSGGVVEVDVSVFDERSCAKSTEKGCAICSTNTVMQIVRLSLNAQFLSHAEHWSNPDATRNQNRLLGRDKRKVITWRRDDHLISRMDALVNRLGPTTRIGVQQYGNAITPLIERRSKQRVLAYQAARQMEINMCASAKRRQRLAVDRFELETADSVCLPLFSGHSHLELSHQIFPALNQIVSTVRMPTPSRRS